MSTKDAAANWFVRLRDDAVSAADRAAFRAWHDADPTHAAAYLEMERLWEGLDHVEARRTGHIDDTEARTESTAHGRPRVLRRMAVAASVAL
ncbi:MAG: FecR/PupR family sigma factor regulator, partial [Pseudomonadota bacterium]